MDHKGYYGQIMRLLCTIKELIVYKRRLPVIMPIIAIVATVEACLAVIL